jgi:hypothetical protein
MPWTQLVHLGDVWLMLAAAAAIGAWLVAARAWAMAFWWGLLFTFGVSLVGASKVAFMAWGMALPGVDFKALSGHATGVTAVFPTLFYLLLRQRGALARGAGVAAGLVLGALMGVLLVVQDDHSVAEAAAGWGLGALVSLGGIWIGGERPARVPPCGLVLSALVFVVSAGVLRSVPFGYLMARTAVFLSGNSAPFPWNTGS